MSKRIWPLMVILILMTSTFIGCGSVAEAAAEPIAQSEPTAEGEDGNTGLDTLGETIGTLGLFAAIMAILALGTEVTIDVFKSILGLKSKPTALGARANAS